MLLLSLNLDHFEYLEKNSSLLQMNPFHRKLFVPKNGQKCGNQAQNGHENPSYIPSSNPHSIPPPVNNGVNHSRSLSSPDSLLSFTIAFGILIGILLGLFYWCKRSNSSTRRTNPRRFLSTQATHEGNHQLEDPIWFIGTNGLKQFEIESIPVFSYKKDEGIIEGTECSVCLGEFEEDESLKFLPKCNHAFHVACIDAWLQAHNNCPLCRAPILISSNAGVADESGDSRNQNQVDEESGGCEASNVRLEGGENSSSTSVLSESSSSAAVEAQMEELNNRKPKNSSSRSKLMRSFSSARISSKGRLDMKRSSSIGGMF